MQQVWRYEHGGTRVAAGEAAHQMTSRRLHCARRMHSEEICRLERCEGVCFLLRAAAVKVGAGVGSPERRRPICHSPLMGSYH